MNDILQWTAVILILALAAVWIIRRIRRKSPTDRASSPCDTCCGCDLSRQKKKCGGPDGPPHD